MTGVLETYGGTGPSNDGEFDIAFSVPIVVNFTLEGTSPFLFHRWSNEAVKEKAAAAKNSAAKKTDNVESYVYRNLANELCIPGEYVRMSIVNAAKYRQDPRSSRKSAMDLFKAGVVSLTDLASVGTVDWAYIDERRVMVQRAGITRQRPALKTGWTADFSFMVLTPEYINAALLHSVLADAGRLVGVGDFRPSFGRFLVKHYSVQ